MSSKAQGAWESEVRRSSMPVRGQRVSVHYARGAGPTGVEHGEYLYWDVHGLCMRRDDGTRTLIPRPFLVEEIPDDGD